MTRIQNRRATAAEWAAANPVLADGEVGYERSTGKLKVGNGAAAWSGLPYSAVIPGELVFSVRDYGAIGDGSADDTAAIQAASAAAHASSARGVGIYFPPGNYVVTAVTPITKSMTIYGAGSSATSIISKTAVSGIFTVAADRVNITDIYFQCQASIATATSLQPTAVRYISGNLGTIRRCYFAGWYISTSFEGCGSWIFRDNYASRAVMYNLRVENNILPDSGDQVVSGNYFAVGGSYNTEAHIYQVSAGGLRLVDNKILQGKIGFQLAVADGVATSILLAVGNSFEYQTVSAIQLGLKGPSNTGTFQKIIIGHNQITGNSCTSPVVDIIPSVTARLWSIMVDSNIISGSAGSTTFFRARNVDDLAIKGNQLFTGSVGFSVESTVTNVFIDGTNKTQLVTTPFSNASPTPTPSYFPGAIVAMPQAGVGNMVQLYTIGGVSILTVTASNGNMLVAGGLRVGGNYQNLASLYVTPTNTAPGAIIKSGGGTFDLLQFQDQSTTAIRLRVDQSGHIVFDGMGAPAIAAGAAAGTSPTVSLTAGASDSAGQASVTIGTSPTTGVAATITFHDAFAASPRAITLTPSSTAAAAAGAYISAKSATSFTISLANAPTAAAVLSWFYHVAG